MVVELRSAVDSSLVAEARGVFIPIDEARDAVPERVGSAAPRTDEIVTGFRSADELTFVARTAKDFKHGPA